MHCTAPALGSLRELLLTFPQCHFPPSLISEFHFTITDNGFYCSDNILKYKMFEIRSRYNLRVIIQYSRLRKELKESKSSFVRLVLVCLELSIFNFWAQIDLEHSCRESFLEHTSIRVGSLRYFVLLQLNSIDRCKFINSSSSIHCTILILYNVQQVQQRAYYNILKFSPARAKHLTFVYFKIFLEPSSNAKYT